MIRRRIASLKILSACLVLAVVGSALRSFAYVDLAPTLAKIISDAKTIALVEVVEFDRENCAIVLKEVRTLKGEPSADPIRHLVASSTHGTVPLQIAQWVEPGARGVLFMSRSTTLVCVGHGWYQVRRAGTGPWKLGADRPDLPLSYYGSVSRMADGIERILAGKDAILTAVAYGSDDVETSIDLALNRTDLPGLVRVARFNANLKMPPMVMAASANAAYLLGEGPVAQTDLPDLLKKLRSSDFAERAEAAEDLGWLGKGAAVAVEPLRSLLDDASPRVRFSAAAALLRIAPSESRGNTVLATGLTDSDPAVRRNAAQAAGMAGHGAGVLTKSLAALLKDNDQSVRIAAMQAIATLGPAAADAAPVLVPLLDEPDRVIDAADALGRIGPAARPIPASLAKMLSSDQPAVRWAAVRAMSQIGGPEAVPAVTFMLETLPKATTVEAYNMMIYLALIGPDAKDALPALRNLRVMINPIIRSATLWSIDANREFPWQGFGRFGMPGIMGDGPDFGRYIYEAYFHELGDRLASTSEKLQTKIMDGTAGDVPAWGYRLLNCTPDESLHKLIPALADDKLVLRERATVALGYMGPAAAAAKGPLTAALNKASSEQERRLIQWSLREVGGE
jgi:HEAT repeat protein